MISIKSCTCHYMSYERVTIPPCTRVTPYDTAHSSVGETDWKTMGLLTPSTYDKSKTTYEHIKTPEVNLDINGNLDDVLFSKKKTGLSEQKLNAFLLRQKKISM